MDYILDANFTNPPALGMESFDIADWQPKASDMYWQGLHTLPYVPQAARLNVDVSTLSLCLINSLPCKKNLHNVAATSVQLTGCHMKRTKELG